MLISGTPDPVDVTAQLFPFPGYINKDASRNILSTVQRYIPNAKGSRILDFGCGPCDKTAPLQLSGYSCIGIDDLEDYWHRGRELTITTFAERLGICLWFTLDDAALRNHSFGMVMLHDVLEHFHESPRHVLLKLVDLVCPEGYLFVTVPSAVSLVKRMKVLIGRTNMPPFEQYYWSPDSHRDHMREYVRDDLVELAEYLGLEILELHDCHHMLHAVPRGLKALYRLLTALIPGSKDSWLLVAQKPKDWSPQARTDAELRELVSMGGKVPC